MCLPVQLQHLLARADAALVSKADARDHVGTLFLNALYVSEAKKYSLGATHQLLRTGILGLGGETG